MAIIKKGLGRGLDSLFADQSDDEQSDLELLEIDINQIEPNQDQPRKDFEPETLSELSESIKQYGILQPLIVTKKDGFYKIIAGERRYRAARLAKLEKVPAIVKSLSEVNELQIALVENLQRRDLNPIEEALCYRRLIENFGCTQDELSTSVGKNRSSIANVMRLLNLDPRVQNFLVEGRLSMGQGRALLGIEIPDIQFDLAERTIEEDLSVREVEEAVRKINGPDIEAFEKRVKAKSNINEYKHVEDSIMTRLGTRVAIIPGKRKGKIEIEFYSPDDLDRIIDLINN